MKQLTYAYDRYFAWHRSFFPRAAKELDITFTGGWRIDQNYQWNATENGVMEDIEDPENGIINIGRMDPKAFGKELGKSKLLVGLGNPSVSPTPYWGLCLGVPFLNPVSTVLNPVGVMRTVNDFDISVSAVQMERRRTSQSRPLVVPTPRTPKTGATVRSVYHPPLRHILIHRP